MPPGFLGQAQGSVGEVRSGPKAKLRQDWGSEVARGGVPGLRRGALLWHLPGKAASEVGWLVLLRGGHGLGYSKDLSAFIMTWFPKAI